MIPWMCVFVLMYLAPGNPMIYALTMMFCEPHVSAKKSIHFFLLVVWIIASFISCWTSPIAFQCFYGSIYQMEGWFSYLVIARGAWLFWSCFDFKAYSKLTWICLFLVCLELLAQIIFHKPIIMPKGLGGFIAMVSVLFWVKHPALAAISIPCFVLADSRAAIIGSVVGILVWSYLSKKIKWKPTIWVACILIVCIPFTPLLDKIRSIDPSTYGLGARSSWILQSYNLSKEKPILGYGFDSMGDYLKNPVCGVQTPRGRPDRTHNLSYDIIFQTGWFGYLLCLCMFGSCLHFALKYRCDRNSISFAMLCAWIVHSYIAPSAVHTHLLALIAILGIHGREESENI